MKRIVNDEIEKIPWKLIRERRPTCGLRFRDVEQGFMVLEQLWTSDLVGVEDVWVPVMMGNEEDAYLFIRKTTE